jgi:hypothetical protein
MHTPRTLRNKWHKADGVLTKYVDRENVDTDSIDLTDDLEEHQAITPSWDDRSGVTLGAPIAASGIISFTHTGVGSVVLSALFDFVTYLASLIVSYDVSATGTYAVYLHTSAGVGGSVGDVVRVFMTERVYPMLDVASIPETAARFTMPSGAVVVVANITATGSGYFSAELASVLDNSDADVEALTMDCFAEYDDIAEYDLYAAKPTRTLRTEISFVDPSNPTDDGYTP